MSILKAGQYLFALKMGIRREDVINRLAGRKFFEDQFHGYPSSSDNGLAHHYFGVYFDQVFHTFKILLSAKSLDIFPRHLFQLRIRRDDVEHGLHVAVGVFVVDDLFEIEGPPLDLIGKCVFKLTKTR